MATQDAQSRRERRASRRRAHILDAAASVFAAQGVHYTTIKDIAVAADIADGTVYNYFESKEDLVLALLDRLANLDERREVMEHSLQEDVRVFFTRHIADRLTLTLENKTLIAAVLPELLSSPALGQRYKQVVVRPGIEMMEQHLATRQDAGQIPSIDVPVASRLVNATLLGLAVMALFGEEVTENMWSDPQALANVITAFIFDGLNAVSPPKVEQSLPESS
ncbi:MAG TPA: helix-turn-helix domain-containing protein [Bellilinea sp.]|nr:helix-turn-helix domain-containing protein [Bellilinea sp.]